MPSVPPLCLMVLGFPSAVISNWLKTFRVVNVFIFLYLAAVVVKHIANRAGGLGIDSFAEQFGHRVTNDSLPL